jgi:hypothetical protein
MSGSYQQLLQKYNQLLALVLNLPAGVDTLQSVITADDELQGVAPALNQVIKYDGTNVVWSSESQTLNQVLTAGNTTTQSAIFQVGTASTTIEENKVQLTDIASGIGTAIVLDNVTTVPFIQVTTVDTGTGNTNTTNIQNNSLSFISGIGPFFAITGISVSGTGLSINTNGTLTLNGLTGADGQFLKYNSSGNAVWDDIPTPGIFKGTYTVPLDVSTGTVSFGGFLLGIPTVTISQLQDTPGGSIVGLAVTSITNSDFTWISTGRNFGKILWIATL